MASTNPFAYYRMSNLNIGTKTITDTFGFANMVGTSGSIIYSATNEYNQTVLRLSSTTDSFVATSSILKITNSFTIEFTMRINNHFFNGGQIFAADDDSFSVYFTSYVNSSIPTIFLKTKHSPSNEHVMAFSFNNMGRENFGYLMDGLTHHFVLTYDSTTGTKKLYIDGQNPPNFIGNTGVIGNLYTPGSNHSFRLHSGTIYRKLLVDFNHLALYDSVISEYQIFQHYNDILNGNNYSFSENVGLADTEPTEGEYSELDFAPGTDLITNGITQGTTVDQLNQLRKFPLPRYKSGHTLNRLFNWFTVDFIAQSGGGTISAPNASLVSFAKNLMIEYFTNWNYHLPITHAQDVTSEQIANQTTNYIGMLVKLANDNPTIPTQYITLRIQLNNNASTLNNKTLANNYYLQNSGGQFLDRNGAITVVSGSKVWRPLSSTLSIYRPDGLLAKTNIDLLLNALTGRTTPKINMINENAEIIPGLSESILGLDPLFVSEKTTAGAISNQSFYATNYKKLMRDNYADIFMTASTLSGCVYTEYSLEGITDGSDITLNKPWTEVRQINTKINNQYYSTGDFYTRYPYNWRGWISAWHGLQWFIQGRKTEIELGDNLFSPFISAGWDSDERKNIRPAQWLGLLKILSVMGAEFFYTGVFNENIPYPDPKNYIWQTVIPAYAQGITSRFEDILRNGYLLDGDYPRSYDPPQSNGPGYNFYTGDLRKFCVVRKHNTKNEYIIATSFNPVNNYFGGVEEQSICTIYLDNINPLKFNVKRQGSVYFYQSGATPVFYQLDDWHENTHPYYWDSDIKISAPLYDSSTYIPIKTEKTGSTYDFTAFTSYIAFSSATNVNYLVSPRSGMTHYFWIKARSSDGSSTGLSVKMNNGTSYPIGCIKNTNWQWYRRQSSATTTINFSLSAGTNILTITSNNNKLEVSDIHISSSSSDIYNEGTPSAVGLPPVVVSSGGTVVLSAATGNSYLWFPTNETTQIITATTSGTYYVQIDDGSGCTATTNSINVIVNSDEFLTTISALGPTTFAPGGNVILSATTLYYLTATTSFNYIWYSAATILDTYVMAGSGNNYTATSTGYYYVNTISTGTTTTLSSNTIYVNANSVSNFGTTTETKISNPLSYTDSDQNEFLPFETSTIGVLDVTERNYYIFVKIRSRTGEKTGIKVSLDGGNNFASVTNCNSTTFGWYRIGIVQVGYRNYPDSYNSNINVVFRANNNNLVMESYILSKNPTFVPSPYPNTIY